MGKGYELAVGQHSGPETSSEGNLERDTMDHESVEGGGSNLLLVQSEKSIGIGKQRQQWLMWM